MTITFLPRAIFAKLIYLDPPGAALQNYDHYDKPFLFRRLVCPTSTERDLFKHIIEVRNPHSSSEWNTGYFKKI